jgi:hypothetical protein
MTVPELTSNAGIYAFLWKEEKIAIRVDRLAEDSKGTLTGEILIKSGQPGSEKHVHMARINLVSSESRTRLSKLLHERVNTVDWYSILEQSCVMTLAKHREGEPVCDLGDQPEYETARYRLQPLLFDSEPTLIYAPGGTGKSYLALYIACLVQYNIGGIYGWLPLAGNVLVLDWETSRAIYRRRTWAVKQGLGIEDSTERIKYRYCTQPLATDIAEIQKIVIENKINLVIVDSCGYAAGGDPNAAEVAIRYFGALRSIRTATLTLDHVSKGLNGGSSPFGSVYKTNAARSVFQLKKSQDAGANEYELGLYHEKVNEGMPLKPIGYKTKFTNNADGVAIKVVFSQTEIMAAPELTDGKVDLKDKLYYLLKTNGSMGLAEMSAQVGEDKDTVRMTCYRYDETKNKKLFVNLGKGLLWGAVDVSHS